MYDALVNASVKLDFGILPTAVNPANYNPYNKSLKFRENNAITSENLKEELFHVWQDVYCSIARTQETCQVERSSESENLTP